MYPHRSLLLFVLFALTALAFLASPLVVIAATPQAPPPAVMTVDWAQLLIPLATPILIAASKLLVPKIPKVVLPVLAPVLGAALDIMMHFAGLGASGPIVGAILGSAGVGLREIVDQMRKRQANGQ